MRGFLDKDFLRTEENLLFCVVGGIHPKDRVISYLKYVRSSDGKWGEGLERYARTMPAYTIPALLDNIDYLMKHYPQYVFNSKVYNVRMSAVSKKSVREHHCPEEKVEQLFRSNQLDSLQEKTVQLIDYLSSIANIQRDCFGITGSILLGIHHIEFSDIDLIIYGNENSLKIKQKLIETFKTKNSPLNKHSETDLKRLLKKWADNHPITIDEAKNFYMRKWNIGFYKEKFFSIHPVKTRMEIIEEYGSKTYTPIGMIEGTVTIDDISESLFLPSIYGIRSFKNKKENINVPDMNEIASYDGFYSGIFEFNERVEVKGKIERVHIKKTGETHNRIVIGSPEAQGQDYIKII